MGTETLQHAVPSLEAAETGADVRHSDRSRRAWTAAFYARPLRISAASVKDCGSPLQASRMVCCNETAGMLVLVAEASKQRLKRFLV